MNAPIPELSFLERIRNRMTRLHSLNIYDPEVFNDIESFVSQLEVERDDAKRQCDHWESICNAMAETIAELRQHEVKQ